MSFTSTVKSEVSKLNTIESENITELSAIIKNNAIEENKIKIVTENASLARRIFKLIKDLYDINSKIVVRKVYNYNKNLLYIIEISHKKDLIINDTCTNKNIPDEYLVSDNELKRAYLRGLFLATGSINDPKKSRYHLECIVNNEEYAIYISNLKNEFNLNSKVLKRDNKYMIYIKEAEKIGDFLRIINASNAVMYFEDMRIYRDHKNMINRLNNCEQANVDKMIEAANKQINDINTIIEISGLDVLDEKEQIVAEYRLKYKDVSLLELSEIISIETGKQITKSGINHRIKKIAQIAERMRNIK